MKKFLNTLPNTVVAVLIVFAASVAISYAAWNNPTCNPNTDPAPCNTPEPINVGTAAQSKSGTLSVAMSGAPATGFVVGAGRVGIGTAAPTQRLDVQGGNARINNAFLGDVGHGATWAGFSHSSSANTLGYGLLQSNDGRNTLINKRSGGGAIEFRVDNATRLSMNDSGQLSLTGSRLSLTNGNTYFYGDGANTAARGGAFYVQNTAGTGYANAMTNDVWLNSIGRWASSLVPGAAPTLSIQHPGTWNGCNTGSNGGGPQMCAATVTCPAGYVITGGGCSVGGADKPELRDAMILGPNQYYCRYWASDWTGDGDWGIDVWAWAACARLQ